MNEAITLRKWRRIRPNAWACALS